MVMNSAADPFPGRASLSEIGPRRRAVLLVLTLASAWPGGAPAQTLAREWGWCRSDDDDLEIRGCSAVIRSGRDAPEDLARAFANRGRAWSEKGEYSRAMHDLDNAIRLDPGFADAYNYRGVANLSQGRYEQAIGDFGEAIRLDPNYAIAIYNRGLALQAQGRADEAAKDFARAKQVGPRLTEPHK
jgi:tetratricopeptide (TPR) repeat protein